jgi:VCBS repeat-containing protein
MGSVTITDETTGAFTYTPNLDANGSDGFTFKANDSAVDSNTATVTVTINPLNDPPTISGAPNTRVVVGDPYYFKPNSNDVDLDTLTFSITIQPPWASFDTNTGELSGTPTAPDVDTTTSGIVISVTDSIAPDVSLPSFDLTVIQSNNAPIAVDSLITIDEDIPFSGTLSASDADVGDTLRYSIVSGCSKGSVTITDAATGAFTYTPDMDAFGDDYFEFVANDGAADSNIGRVLITINPINDTPVAIDITTVRTGEDTAVSAALSATDPDWDPLTFSTVTDPSMGSVTITDPTTGAFTYTPNLNANGADTFTFGANDGVLYSNTATVTITIVPVNDAPTISGTPETSVFQYSLYSFTPVADDVDQDTLIFSILNQPPWATFDTATGTLQGTPGKNDDGIFPGIVISVTDGQLTASLPPFDLEVINVYVEFITRLFNLYLDRDPSDEELYHWVELVIENPDLGKTAWHILDEFIFHNEYFENKNTTNGEFITILFNALFERDPSASEYTYWVNQLDSGTTREESLDSLVRTSEFEEYCNSMRIIPYPGYVPPAPLNQPPDQPVLLSPLDYEVNVQLAPQLQTEIFSDPDSGDTHARTQWQISTASDFSDTSQYVFDVDTPDHLTSITLPDFVLDVDTDYYWRVRFYDNSNEGSEWSVPYVFTTRIDDPDDLDQNGIPDAQEVDDTVDLDGDGTPDNYQGDIKSVNTEGGEIALIGVKVSTNVADIQFIKSVDPDTISDTVNKPAVLPLGLINFRIRLHRVGDTASVIIYLSEAAREDAKWYKYDIVNGWQDYSEFAFIDIGGRSVTLRLTDGGSGDADGTANGIIIDPSGLAEEPYTPPDVHDPDPDTGPAVDSSPRGEEGGGGGCFIATAARASVTEDRVNVLSEFVFMFLALFSTATLVLLTKRRA